MYLKGLREMGRPFVDLTVVLLLHRDDAALHWKGQLLLDFLIVMSTRNAV